MLYTKIRTSFCYAFGKKYTLFILTLYPVLLIRGYIKITLHNEGREIRGRVSETLNAAEWSLQKNPVRTGAMQKC